MQTFIDIFLENPAAQVLGFLGMLLTIASYAFRSDKTLKIVLGVGQMFFVGHYFLLALPIAMTSAIMTVASSFLSISKKFVWSGYIFLAVYVYLSVTQFSQGIAVFPALSGVIFILSLYFLSGISMRLAFLGGVSLWMIHNYYFGSISIITDISIFVVNFITIIRIRTAKN